jgi:hypothetical protein
MSEKQPIVREGNLLMFDSSWGDVELVGMEDN